MEDKITHQQEINILYDLMKKLFSSSWGKIFAGLLGSAMLVIATISTYGFVIAKKTNTNSTKIDSVGNALQMQVNDIQANLETIYDLYSESIDSSKSFRYEMRGNIDLLMTLQAQTNANIMVIQTDIKELLKSRK